MYYGLRIFTPFGFSLVRCINNLWILTLPSFFTDFIGCFAELYSVFVCVFVCLISIFLSVGLFFDFAIGDTDFLFGLFVSLNERFYEFLLFSLLITVWRCGWIFCFGVKVLLLRNGLTECSLSGLALRDILFWTLFLGVGGTGNYWVTLSIISP